MKKTTTIILGVFLLLLLSSCAHVQNVDACVSDKYGFWGGLWHGIIAPITFIISLFPNDITVFAPNNNGSWYTFGFLLGVGGTATGTAKSTK